MSPVAVLRRVTMARKWLPEMPEICPATEPPVSDWAQIWGRAVRMTIRKRRRRVFFEEVMMGLLSSQRSAFRFSPLKPEVA